MPKAIVGTLNGVRMYLQALVEVDTCTLKPFWNEHERNALDIGDDGQDTFTMLKPYLEAGGVSELLLVALPIDHVQEPFEVRRF